MSLAQMSLLIGGGRSTSGEGEFVMGRVGAVGLHRWAQTTFLSRCLPDRGCIRIEDDLATA